MEGRILFMKLGISLFAVLFSGMLLMAGAGCNSNGKTGPKELVDKYFSSAVRKDYAAAYECYYAPYTAKVSKDEYLKHRKEASVLQSYNVVSLKREGDDAAQAEVKLTFAPSEKFNRKEPVTVTVKENLVKESGRWRIKVW
jgi:hypothetical protein